MHKVISYYICGNLSAQYKEFMLKSIIFLFFSFFFRFFSRITLNTIMEIVELPREALPTFRTSDFKN